MQERRAAMIVEHEILEQCDPELCLSVLVQVCPDRERFRKAVSAHLRAELVLLWRIENGDREQVPNWDRMRVLEDESIWGSPESSLRYTLELTDKGARHVWGDG